MSWNLLSRKFYISNGKKIHTKKSGLLKNWLNGIPEWTTWWCWMGDKGADFGLLFKLKKINFIKNYTINGFNRVLWFHFNINFKLVLFKWLIYKWKVCNQQFQ